MMTCMKKSQIAFWVSAVGALVFLYNIHQIHGVEEDAAVWEAQVSANNNPGAGSYVEAFFDGFTLGAFSNGDIFAVAHKQDQISQGLETERVTLLNQYNNAVYYRNWGFIIGVGSLLTANVVRKKENVKVLKEPGNQV